MLGRREIFCGGIRIIFVWEFVFRILVFLEVCLLLVLIVEFGIKRKGNVF